MARKMPAKRASRANPREDRNQTPTQQDNKQRFNIVPIKKVSIFPKSVAQEIYLDALEDTNKSIVIATGPAGTGKSYLATLFAIRSLMAGDFKKIIITRPTVSAGEDIGFLPGNIFDKLAPWSIPILDIFKEIYPLSVLERMIKDEGVEIAGLGLMRGRAQPLDSIIQTPLGPKKMGELAVGDSVLGSNGKATEVTGVFPQGKKQIYRVTFSDGVSTLASGDHLWSTRSLSERKHGKNYSIKTTEEILESSLWKDSTRNHEVPIMSEPADFTLDLDLPVDPYLMGAMLGDGTNFLSLTSFDEEIVNECEAALPETIQMVDAGEGSYRFSHTLPSKSLPNVLKRHFQKLGLSGHRSYEKFIPQAYKYARVEDRISLLQGLMDTDGCIWDQKNRSPRIQFYSTSSVLTEDVAWLVRSLGGTGKVRRREHDLKETRTDRAIFHRRDSFVVEISLPQGMQLSRKASKFTGVKRTFRFIDRIEAVDMQECQCISVSAEDHLYLTDDFIVTHNTLKNAIIIFDESQNATPEQCLMAMTRIGEGSRMIITGDLKQHDRGYAVSGLGDVIDRIAKKGSNRIAVCHFGTADIERHPVVEDVLRIYGEA